ncbi:pentapeptide repeat-containing protein [Streptomyces sp. NPDC015237]|uniref:pentapeptide repeat-containing protein n=1 Tax=unclassified Streptomyces TaxID=2593676 RepID=UPI0036F724AC
MLLVLVGLPLLLWRGPALLDGEYITTATLKGGTSAAMAALITGLRTSIVAFTAALGAGIALLYTARTYRLSRRGQITERFTKALERLGSDEVYVRIGGILALEQIVRDAPEQAATDSARVLGHFIRERAPKAHPGNVSLPESPTADVQEALTALTRPASRTHVDPREPLNLRGLHLAGAHLAGADLTRADLSGATLTHADLTKATLTRARLTDAKLTEAILIRARLTGAILYMATLTKAHLQGATLARANLQEAALAEANLYGANLKKADLQKANLTKANLQEATLTEANLRWATLTEAGLDGANLMKAYLRKATLTEADLDGANLTGANLCGASLTGVEYLNVRSICSAVTDRTTALPPKFYPRTDTPATPD